MLLKLFGLLVWTVLLCIATAGMYINRDEHVPVSVQWAMAGVFALSLAMIEVFQW